jgi:hypothetical protein
MADSGLQPLREIPIIPQGISDSLGISVVDTRIWGAGVRTHACTPKSSPLSREILENRISNEAMI